MPIVAFDALPDRGRLWVFPATQALSAAQSDAFLQAVDPFLDAWAAHGVPLRSGRELRDDRFLVIGVDVDVEAPSGCSIDTLVNRLRGLGTELGVSLIDHAPVWYRDGEQIRTATRAEFRALAESGAVGPETPVFDTSLTTIGSFRAGELEQPAAATWHGPAFFWCPAPEVRWHSGTDASTLHPHAARAGPRLLLDPRLRRGCPIALLFLFVAACGTARRKASGRGASVPSVHAELRGQDTRIDSAPFSTECRTGRHPEEVMGR